MLIEPVIVNDRIPFSSTENHGEALQPLVSNTAALHVQAAWQFRTAAIGMTKHACQEKTDTGT